MGIYDQLEVPTHFVRRSSTNDFCVPPTVYSQFMDELSSSYIKTVKGEHYMEIPECDRQIDEGMILPIIYVNIGLQVVVVDPWR